MDQPRDLPREHPSWCDVENCLFRITHAHRSTFEHGVYLSQHGYDERTRIIMNLTGHPIPSVIAGPDQIELEPRLAHAIGARLISLATQAMSPRSIRGR